MPLRYAYFCISEKLHEIFTKLKFQVVTRTNLSTEAMNKCLDEICNEDHQNTNAFICCILTHGTVGKLAGCDGNYIAIHSILDKFTQGKCPSLSKKPKIFFIQACQGEEVQEMFTLQTDSPSQPSGVGTGLDEIAPSEKDFLVCLATIPGHVSYRNTELGSWFIGVLVDKLERLHEKEDLMSILTVVNRKLSKESERSLGKSCGQISFPITTLLKKVYFPLWESASKSKFEPKLCNHLIRICKGVIDCGREI